ncbi:hypothetical protein JK2ML_2478 [Mycobacterium leprae Kyoto-2]|uniref:Uncharacterized protein n=3 Tax=Mycobacterium leprae TaxID=1769 RepID=Q9CB30_MYCLE|nr:hypothetical protein DIJ64_13655 [Mycobacterium leprae]OAR19713.1 hypothetical protein A8144_13705 [Mycobacterium leprae 3125609]OAX70163.1 hypothetical protein A3216_13665 [Mycobacterium leprae 7935681]CAR72577.1 hypothetical protein MLBr02478 [Mycobacterium leprae Br4923]BBC17767.1 hypothetical protein JK2ML_2478 [Mycobacterium leprae Kyoto-2]
MWYENSGGLSADELAYRYHEQLREDTRLAASRPRTTLYRPYVCVGQPRLQARRVDFARASWCVVGAEKFFALIRNWLTWYRHATVVTDDFTGLVANYSEKVVAAIVGYVAVFDGSAVTDTRWVVVGVTS